MSSFFLGYLIQQVREDKILIFSILLNKDLERVLVYTKNYSNIISLCIRLPNR